MEQANNKTSGLRLNNFTAAGASLLILVLAFATGFFAKSYFENRPSEVKGSAVKATDTDTQSEKSAVTLEQIKGAFNKSLIKFGDTSKKVVFVEVSDPSCPYCNIAAGKNGELNKQASSSFTLVKDGGDYQAPVEEIRRLVDTGQASYALIYKPGHGNGEVAMEAFYCAYDLGKFWQVHDLLMNGDGYNLINNTVKNDKTKTQDLVNFLASVIDVNTLKDCIESGKYDTRLQEETSLAGSLGVSGTPTFFINDKMFSGAYNFKDMQPTVDPFLE